MIPIFRYRSRGVARAMRETPTVSPGGDTLKEKWTSRPLRCLPSIMREGFVRIGHPVCVLPPFDRDTAIIGGIEKFARKSFFHRVLRPTARTRNQPADRQRLAALGPNFHRHLVSGATDPAGAHFNRGTHIAERIMEHAQRILAAAFGDAVQGPVDNPFGNRLLALVHQAVHELGQDGIAELGVRQDLAFDGGATARHARLSYCGRLAPYFERRWRRSLTPWVSRVPRMM